MKLVLVSDTHGAEPELPDGDVLVHAGDLTMMGTLQQLSAALDWLLHQAGTYSSVVVIAGNHDFFAEAQPTEMRLMVESRGFHYLDDSGVTIDGVKFWGSPVSPWFQDWAFNRQRGEDIRRHWDRIPTDTDVLVTHGPPLGVLDRTLEGEPVGCADLNQAVKRVQPRVHVFGHIHEGYGKMMRPTDPETEFYNASIVDRGYRPVNAPHLVDVAW